MTSMVRMRMRMSMRLMREEHADEVEEHTEEEHHGKVSIRSMMQRSILWCFFVIVRIFW